MRNDMIERETIKPHPNENNFMCWSTDVHDEL